MTVKLTPVTPDQKKTLQLQDTTQRQVEERTFFDELGRQLGMSGRHMIAGLAKVATGLADATVPYINLATPEGANLDTISQRVDPFLDRLGFPQPEGRLEEYVQTGSEFAVGAAPFVAAPRLATRAGKVLTGVAENLATKPGMQFAGGVTGGAAVEGTVDLGGGPISQALAGLVGGVAPGLAQDLTRASMRSADNIAQTTATLESAGVTPQAADYGRGGVASTQHRLRQANQGGVLSEAMENRAVQLQERVNQVTDRLGPTGTTQEVGTQIHESLIGTDGTGGYVGRSKTVAEGLYDEVEAFVPADTPMALDNTMDVFAAPSSADAIPMTTKRLGSSFTKLLGEDLAADIAAYTDQWGTWNDLPYQAIRRVRTMVGDKMDQGILDPNVNQRDLGRVYKALSDDLKAGVIATGDNQAIRAMEAADAFWKTRAANLDAVKKVVNRNGGPEAVYKTLMSGTADGATQLGKIYSLLDTPARDALTNSFVHRLGRASPGQQGATGGKFSLNTYLTNWNKISPEAKNVLMRDRPEIGRATDAIARVAEQHKIDMSRYANTSGTAGQTYFTGRIAGAVSSMMAGEFGMLAGFLALPVLTGSAGKMMLNQTFVTWLAKNARQPMDSMPMVINQGVQMARRDNDVDMLEFMAQLEAAYAEIQAVTE